MSDEGYHRAPGGRHRTGGDTDPRRKGRAMRQFIAAILISLFLAVTTGAAEEDPESAYDFRNSRWGMTKLEVMALEALKPVSFSGPFITYQAPILGKEMHLIYEFIENRLVGAYYIFVIRQKNDRLEIRDLLERKYGPPESHRDSGPDDYHYAWQTSATEIVLRPGRARDCRIEYSSRKFHYLRLKKKENKRKQEEEEIMENF